jgi:hypothetical protein
MKMRDIIRIVEGETDFRVLYHATNAFKYPHIMAHGLDPERSKTTKAVFLTDRLDVARTYTSIARSYILAIDVTMLDLTKLGPDDFDLPDKLRRLAPDDRWLNARWQDVPWQVSLQLVHQAAYQGVIPSAAISIAERVGIGADHD